MNTTLTFPDGRTMRTGSRCRYLVALAPTADMRGYLEARSDSVHTALARARRARHRVGHFRAVYVFDRTTGEIIT